MRCRITNAEFASNYSGTSSASHGGAFPRGPADWSLEQRAVG